MSNNGQPLRRFMQTFVLAPQSPKKYYVHNDIFRYQVSYSSYAARSFCHLPIVQVKLGSCPAVFVSYLLCVGLLGETLSLVFPDHT